ncbi:autotransporter outer membrane beta-barrel domain-containing protein [Pseudomonas chlororaphis]|uniref:Autotransporter domain-containing protein n=1 Tax=Pseudomonas chlororaphis TaxID=587753 RepID=A0A0D5Y3A8_9PSED|nr:autotransporter outer membrane beta-barrel domain-containing protein [Pseudomonas chlororaphis]AKA25469.1 hypothetical protein PCL1606_40200 [Pseudomonas chlororaphis]
MTAAPTSHIKLRLFQKNKLATAVAVACLHTTPSFANLPTDPAGNYAQANSGTTLNLTGNYDAIMATGGGIINSSGGLILGGNGIGLNGNNITAKGPTTKITLADGSIFSEGTFGNGAISVDSGATVELQTFSIEASGENSMVEVRNAGSVVLTNSQLSASGATGNGLIAVEAGSNITVNGGGITTTGEQGAGAYAIRGGSISLTDTQILTQGDNNATGLVTREADSAIQMSGGSITTEGKGSNGASALGTSSIKLDNTTVQTQGTSSIGVSSGLGAQLESLNSRITTNGQYAHGALVTDSGSGLSLNNTTIKTLGESARGAIAHSASLVSIGGSISTAGRNAAGAWATTGSTVTLQNTPVTTSGSNSIGLLAEDAGTTIQNTGGSITTTGASSHGAQALSGGAIVLTGTPVQTSGNGALGLQAQGSGSTVSSSGNIITTTGVQSHGAQALNGGTVTLTDATVQTSGLAALGISSEGTNSTVTVTNSTLSTANASVVEARNAGSVVLTNSQLSASGATGNGLIAVEAGSNITVNGGGITTTGEQGAGAYAIRGGSISLTDTQILTQGDNNATGLVTREADSAIQMSGGSITTEGKGSNGASALGTSSIKLDNTTVQTQGTSSIGVSSGLGAQLESLNSRITTNGQYAHGALVTDSGSGLSLNNTTIKTLGESARGAIAHSASLVSIGGSISTAGRNAAGAWATTGSTVTLQNTPVTTSGSNSIGLLAEDAGTTIQNTGGSITTTGASSHGAQALSGGAIVLTGTPVQTSGNGALGLQAQGSGSTVSSSGNIITTTGVQSHGAQALNGGTVTLTDATVQTSGLAALGISSEGTNSTVTVTNSTLSTANASVVEARNAGSVVLTNSQLSASGATGNGLIAVEAGSNITVNGGGITTTGEQGAGAYAIRGGSISLTDTQILTQGDNNATGLVTREADSAIQMSGGSITTEGKGSNGASALGTSSIKLDNTTVQTQGTSSIGVSSGLGAQLESLNSRITTNGQYAHGALVTDSGSGLSLNNTTIKTLGESARGAIAHSASLVSIGGSISTAGRNAAGAWATTGSTVTLQNTPVTTSGSNSIGLLAEDASTSIQSIGGQITTIGEVSYAVQAKKGGTVSLDNVTASTTGDNTHVLTTLDGGNIAVRTGSLVAAGANSSALLATAADTSSVSNVVLSNTQVSSTAEAFRVDGARLNLTLNSTSVTAGSGVLLNAMANTSSQGATTQFNLINSQLSGDINSDSMSNTSVNLAQNTLLTGTIRQGSGVTIDANSRWNMTGSSSIGALNHSGTVVFENTPGFKTLTLAGDLTGHGQFQMNADLSVHQGDLLVIQGQASGDHTLIIADTGKEPDQSGGHLTVVNTQGGSGQFTLFGGHVDAGAFRYSLEREGNNWALVNPDIGPQPCEVDNSCPPVDPEPKPEDLSKGSNAAVSMQTARAALWNAETDALIQRLGDLRLNHDQGGLWIRAMDTRYKFDTDTSRAFNQNIHGLQVGADKAINVELGKVYLGGFVGVGESRQDFGEGAKGQIDSKTVGVYATYLHDNGIYVDTVAKFSRYDNDVKMPNNLGNKVKGSFDNNAYGVSVEVGKRFNLDQDWFIEPQVQLSSGRLQGGRYTSSDGLQVKYDAIDTLQSRVGGLLGNTIKLNNAMTVQPYIKASWVTEHRGDSEVRINDVKLKAELPGNRGEAGFGAILQLGSQHKLSLDAEYAKGSGIEQPWAVNLGYRFAM